MRRSTTLFIAVLFGILVGFLAGRWAASTNLQRRLAPSISYHILYHQLEEAQKGLAESATPRPQEVVSADLFVASTRLAEASRVASALEVKLSAVYEESETYLPYRIMQLSEAARALAQAQLRGQQLNGNDPTTLQLALKRLLGELPNPDGADITRVRSGLHALSSSDPSLVPLINRGR